MDQHFTHCLQSACVRCLEVGGDATMQFAAAGEKQTVVADLLNQCLLEPVHRPLVIFYPLYEVRVLQLLQQASQQRLPGVGIQDRAHGACVEGCADDGSDAEQVPSDAVKGVNP